MKLWIAQGFGVGRIPLAPGTFGSVVGLGWFFLLLTFHGWLALALGIIFGMAVSVWLCGTAERILNKKDPGSVVLDEIIAIPICFAGWLTMICLRQHEFVGPGYFVSSAHWWQTAGVFVLFRIFDVWKPWPVRQSQALSGGWGVTVDDVLAAVYVNAVVLLLNSLWRG